MPYPWETQEAAPVKYPWEQQATALAPEYPWETAASDPVLGLTGQMQSGMPVPAAGPAGLAQGSLQLYDQGLASRMIEAGARNLTQAPVGLVAAAAGGLGMLGDALIPGQQAAGPVTPSDVLRFGLGQMEQAQEASERVQGMFDPIQIPSSMIPSRLGSMAGGPAAPEPEPGKMVEVLPPQAVLARMVTEFPDVFFTGGAGLAGRLLARRAGAKAVKELAEVGARNTLADVAQDLAGRVPVGVVTDLEPVGPAAREALRAPGTGTVQSRAPGVVTGIMDPITLETASRVAGLRDAALSANRPVASWLAPDKIGSLELAERNLLADEIGGQIVKQAEAGRQVARQVDKASGLEGRLQPGRATRAFRDWAARPEVIAEQAGPEVRELLFEGLGVQAHRNQLGMQRAHQDYWVAALEDASGLKVTDRKFDRWLREHVTLGTTSHGGVQITRDEAAHLLAMVKDPDNRDVILNHGLWLHRLGNDAPVKITGAALQSLEEGLAGDGASKMAQAAFDRMPAVAAEINEATSRTLGQEIAIRQRYFHRSRAAGEEPKALGTFQDLRNEVLDSIGLLKERTGGSKPVVLHNLSDDFISHVSDSTRFSANLEPTTVTTEILADPKVAKALKGRLGESGYKALLGAIDAQTVPIRDRHAWSTGIRAATRPIGGGILGFRPGPVLKAPAGLAISMAYEDNALLHLASGVKALGRFREVNELASKYSPVWVDRYQGHGFMHQVTSGMGGTTVRRFGPKTAAEYGLQPLEQADRAVNVVRWGMAEQEVAEKMPHLARGTDEWGEEVAKQWERQLYRGDNTAHGMEMSQILQYGKRNPLAGQYLMFQSAASKAYSLAPRALAQLQRGDVSGAIKSSAALLASTLYTSAVGTTLRAAHRLPTKELQKALDPREKDTREQYLKDAAVEFAGQVPLVGNLGLQALARHALGGGFWQLPAGTVEDQVLDFVRGAADLMGAAQDYMTNDYDTDGPEFEKKLRRGLLRMGESVATFRGLPFGGVKYDLETAHKMLGDFAPGEEADPADEVLGRSRRKDDEGRVSKAGHKLRAAVADGDSALFREALVNKKKALGSMKQLAILSSVFGQKRYAGLSKFEPRPVAGFETNKERLALSEEELSAIDARLAERDRVREMALSLLRENQDLITGFVGDGQDYLELVKAGGD